MIKPRGYDEVQGFQSSKRLPKGGYICEIKKIEEAKSKAGNDVLKVYLDIAEGEYQGIFMEKWENTPLVAGKEKRWGMISTILVFDTTTGETNRNLKGFLTSVEESNPGFIVDKCWGDNFCKFFKGKVVGCVFGDEYFRGTDGELHASAKPRFYVSADKIKKGVFKIPADKYPPAESSSDNSFAAGFEGFTDVTGAQDECPF